MKSWTPLVDYKFRRVVPWWGGDRWQRWSCLYWLWDYYGWSCAICKLPLLLLHLLMVSSALLSGRSGCLSVSIQLMATCEDDDEESEDQTGAIYLNFSIDGAIMDFPPDSIWRSPVMAVWWLFTCSVSAARAVAGVGGAAAMVSQHRPMSDTMARGSLWWLSL